MPELSIFDYKINPAKITEDNIVPILVLLILPVLIAEILYGSTYLNIIIVVVPEIGIYGCYNLMVRKFVMSRPLKTTSIVIFGLAFALLEQLILRQTSLAPLAIVTPSGSYGRIDNVNVLYLIWALGYQGIWGVFIPQKLFDLIYPEKRNTQLTGTIGLTLAFLLFVASCYVEWYTWTRIAYPLYNGTNPYQPDPSLLLYGLMIIALLIYFAMINKKKRSSIHKSTFSIPQFLMIDVMVFILSLSWFWLLLFAYGAFPGISIIQPILFSIFISVVAFIALFYWSTSSNWTDMTTLNVLISALVASMLAGFITNGLAQPVDIMAKVIFDIAGIVLLIKLYKKTVSNNDKIANENENESEKEKEKGIRKVKKEKVVRKII